MMDVRIAEIDGKHLALSSPECLRFIHFEGFSGFELEGIWTDGPVASITMRLPRSIHPYVALRLNLRALVLAPLVTCQNVAVTVNDRPAADWQLAQADWQWQTLLIERALLGDAGQLRVELSIPTCAQPKAAGYNSDTRLLGVMFKMLVIEELATPEIQGSPLNQLGRFVGTETRKSFDQKLISGFWSRYIQGPSVLEIGFKGYHDVEKIAPVVEGAIGIDIDYPGYDGRTLPFDNDSQDAVYSSHCLEHIADYVQAIRDWYRVVRPGGHIITVVPSSYLYERQRHSPSRWNADHRRFYTPSSLLAEFDAALLPNCYRVRHLAENDLAYDYGVPLEQHPSGCYEIELVIEKITAPSWTISE